MTIEVVPPEYGSSTACQFDPLAYAVAASAEDIIGVWTVEPSPRVKVPGLVTVLSNWLAHEALK